MRLFLCQTPTYCSSRDDVFPMAMGTPSSPLARLFARDNLQYDADSDGMLTEKEWMAYLRVSRAIDCTPCKHSFVFEVSLCLSKLTRSLLELLQ